jgi:hypothetical protein
LNAASSISPTSEKPNHRHRTTASFSVVGEVRTDIVQRIHPGYGGLTTPDGTAVPTRVIAGIMPPLRRQGKQPSFGPMTIIFM